MTGLSPRLDKTDHLQAIDLLVIEETLLPTETFINHVVKNFLKQFDRHQYKHHQKVLSELNHLNNNNDRNHRIPIRQLSAILQQNEIRKDI